MAGGAGCPTCGTLDDLQLSIAASGKRANQGPGQLRSGQLHAVGQRAKIAKRGIGLMAGTMEQALVPAKPVSGPQRDWQKIVAAYREPSISRSIVELVVTAAGFIVLWAAAWAAYSVSYVLTLLIAIPASLFLLRLFLIQHDCGHQSLFINRATNDWIGRVIGVFTMTPYDVWRRSHAIHHASSGNLDRRGIGDIHTLTVQEYRQLSPLRKIGYHLYRHPAVMFGIGPAYVFLLVHRIPVGQMSRAGWMPWISTMGTNAAIALACGVMIWLIGLVPFLLIHIPIVVLAATIGVWLFYVQHQFEETFWEEAKNWTHEEAALYGSSYYVMPPILSWFTANIGVHHVHHLYSRIPFYRLPQVLRDYPELAHVRRITTLEGFRYVKLKLWDPENKRLVSFKEARQIAAG